MTPMQRRTFKRLQHIAKKFGLDLQRDSAIPGNSYLHVGDHVLSTWISEDGRVEGGLDDEAGFQARCEILQCRQAQRLAETLG